METILVQKRDPDPGSIKARKRATLSVKQFFLVFLHSDLFLATRRSSLLHEYDANTLLLYHSMIIPAFTDKVTV